MRRWLNENGATVTAIAVGLMVFSLFAIARQSKRPTYIAVPQIGYYADPANGELFEAQVSEDPLPIAPSGQPAMRVYVFSCGDCDNPADQFVGWVEKIEIRNPSPRASSVDNLEQGDRMPEALPRWRRYRRFVRRPDETEWVRQRSPEGMAILEEVQGRCGDTRYAEPCLPQQPKR